jgi:hypothetical protein
MDELDEAAPAAVTTLNHYGIVAADLRELPLSQEMWSSVDRPCRKSWKSASAKRLPEIARGVTFALVNQPVSMTA